VANWATEFSDITTEEAEEKRGMKSRAVKAATTKESKEKR
jgi:hypothetical protein